jgi:hypothetical protein
MYAAPLSAMVGLNLGLSGFWNQALNRPDSLNSDEKCCSNVMHPRKEW